MKRMLKLPVLGFLSLSILAGHFGQARGDTAVTTPVGYGAETLFSGLNLYGLRFHHSTLMAGAIGELEEDRLTIAEQTSERSFGWRKGDFEKALASLQPGKTYILEIRSGKQAGALQEITRWEGGRFFLPENLLSAGVKTGDQVALREAATLASVFGTTGSALRQGADRVIIPIPGRFNGRVCSLDEAGVWRDEKTGENVNSVPLIYPDGVIIATKREGVVLVGSGETRPGPMRSILATGMNVVSTPDPAESTLQSLGLEDDLKSDENPRLADEVWVGRGYGEFVHYFLKPDGRWWSSSKNEPVSEPVPLKSAVIIDRKGLPVQICISSNKPLP